MRPVLYCWMLVHLCCIIYGQWWWPTFYCWFIFAVSNTASGGGLHSTVSVYLPFCTKPIDGTCILLLSYCCCIVNCQWWWPALYHPSTFAVSYRASGGGLHLTVGVSLLHCTQPEAVDCTLLWCIYAESFMACGGGLKSTVDVSLLYNTRHWQWPAFYCLCVFALLYTASWCNLYSTVGVSLLYHIQPVALACILL